LRTYDVTFDKTKYDINVENSLWKNSIYDNENRNVLNLTEYGVTRTEYKVGYSTRVIKPYTKRRKDI
jgi:hypothetical protein